LISFADVYAQGTNVSNESLFRRAAKLLDSDAKRTVLLNAAVSQDHITVFDARLKVRPADSLQ